MSSDFLVLSLFKISSALLLDPEMSVSIFILIFFFFENGAIKETKATVLPEYEVQICLSIQFANRKRHHCAKSLYQKNEAYEAAKT